MKTRLERGRGVLIARFARARAGQLGGNAFVVALVTLQLLLLPVVTACSGPIRVLVPLEHKQPIDGVSLQVTAPKQRVDVLKQRKRVLPQLERDLRKALSAGGLKVTGPKGRWHLVVEVVSVSRGRQGLGNGTENTGRCDARVSLLDHWPGQLGKESRLAATPALQFEVAARAKTRGKYDSTDVGRAALGRCATLIVDYLARNRIPSP